MQNPPGPRQFAFVVVAIAMGVLPFAALLVFAIRELGRQVLDVPLDVPSLKSLALIPATVMPVTGTALGYFLSYRKPSLRSLRTFLVGSAIFTTIALAITVLPLLSSSNASAIGITIAIDLAPVLVASAALLFVGPAQRDRTSGPPAE